MTSDIETTLRASLTEHARHAPDGVALAERIIVSTRAAAPARRPAGRTWRTWTLPLIAAGSVAAVVGAVVGVSTHRPVAQHRAPVGGSGTASAPHLPAPAPPATVPPRVRVSTPSGPPQPPARFRVTDLTFVGPDDGWALGTGQCYADPSARCTALLRTVDGGGTWASVTNPPANVAAAGEACAEPCVGHLRFADDRVGYAYGPAALFMTTDGGATWQRLPGGADALETLDGDVIRVSADHRGCPPACRYAVQTAAIGSASWRDAALPSAPLAVGAALVRGAGHAYLALFQNPAGGAGDARTSVYSSADNGRTWIARGDPCPSAAAPGEVDTTRIAAGGTDGSLAVLCSPRLAGGGQFVVTSGDGGAAFSATDRRTLGAEPVTAFGAASASALFLVSDDLYRSVDGGAHWRRQHAEGGTGPMDASWIGFESAVVGRVVSADGSTVWTTRDAGVTWSHHTFS